MMKQHNYNNSLLEECLAVLFHNAVQLPEDERIQVYEKFIELIPFLPWGINWKRFSKSQEVDHIVQLYDICSKKEFYIIWNKDYPVIKCSLTLFIEYFDHISAVDPDTWLISTDYREVIEFYHEGSITVGIVETIYAGDFE